MNQKQKLQISFRTLEVVIPFPSEEGPYFMLNLTRLIVAGVMALYTFASFANVLCDESQANQIPLILVEDSKNLSFYDSETIDSIEWSEKMYSAGDSISDRNSRDTFLYTATIMNFLEISSLTGWLLLDTSNQENIFVTRLGLFFLQLSRSSRIQDLWTGIVQEVVPLEEIKFYQGTYTAHQISLKYSNIDAQNEYIKKMSKMLILLGQRLYLLSRSQIQVPFSFISIISYSPKDHYEIWQELLSKLVQWQFEQAQPLLNSYYCDASQSGAEILVIKIPPTPLLDYYIGEFEKWSKSKDVPLSLDL